MSFDSWRSSEGDPQNGVHVAHGSWTEPIFGRQTVQHALDIDGIVRDDRLGMLLTLAVATGMRKGELLGLRWQDVDFRAGTLTVRHTLQAQSRELGQPKTERSRRTLQLPGIALSALTEQRKRQAADGIVSHFVFASTAASPLDARNVSRVFQKALEQAGLPRQRFHNLRHAFATLMIESGEELAIVSGLLGHSGIGTTADTYAHLSGTMERRAADRINAILNRTG